MGGVGGPAMILATSKSAGRHELSPWGVSLAGVGKNLPPMNSLKTCQNPRKTRFVNVRKKLNPKKQHVEKSWFSKYNTSEFNYLIYHYFGIELEHFFPNADAMFIGWKVSQ